jgi:2-keto-4-pentenoate hydratase/2-oxohepta-3-ene-1,7-dioic acid hydratase in catechol pathway
MFFEDQPIPVVQHDGTIFRLTEVLGEGAPTSIFAFLNGWAHWHPALVAAPRPANRDVALSGQFLPPVVAPRKVICIGVNYHDHIREMRMPTLPEFPYAFLRPATCLAGHEQTVPLPDWPKFIDWEAELGIVVGRGGRGLHGKRALDAIAGYTVVNDISARDWIEKRPGVGIDWVMQKGWDCFQPTGPWLVPADFVPDPGALDIMLTVNGETKQHSNTSQLIFGVQAIMEHLSTIMTLEAGDIIATGTPAGVGFGAKPRQNLKKGDVVRVIIEGIGSLENRMS